MSKRPAYDVFVSRKGSDDKVYYSRVGAIWEVASGGLSIKLDALPVDGSLVAFPPKEQTED